MYPLVPIPTHIGLTALGPEIQPYFETMINLEQKTDFESVILPKLATERKLYTFSILIESWVAINDMKGVRTLMAALEQEKK